VVAITVFMACADASLIPSIHVPVPLSITESIKALSSSAAITSALKRQGNLTVGDDAACGICVNYVDQYIVGVYIEAVQYACQHAHTAKEIADCRWIAAHPQVFLGALVEEIKPVKSAVFYCLGAKYCGDVDQAKAAVSSSSSDDTASIAVQLEQAVYPLLTDDVLTTSPLAADMKGVTQAKYTADFITVKADNNVTCAQCVGYWIEVQIVVALHDIGAYCEAHKNIRKIALECQWIANHVPFVVGVLLAKLQPGKFAAGICIGAQYCPIGNSQLKTPQFA